MEGDTPLNACYFGDFFYLFIFSGNLVRICIRFERKPETLLLKTTRKYIHCTWNNVALLQALMHSEVNSVSWEYGDTHTHTHTQAHTQHSDGSPALDEIVCYTLPFHSCFSARSAIISHRIQCVNVCVCASISLKLLACVFLCVCVCIPICVCPASHQSALLNAGPFN